MKKYVEDLKYILPLCLLLLLSFSLTWAHQGHIIVDSGRELYYPLRILQGSVLYKDLFNIYGPFSYLFNALLFKVFAVKLSTLYLAGIVIATGIISCIYLISRLFFEKLLSFSITALSIILGCFSFYIFNYVFPYSFGMTYGLFACFISLYLLILFIRKNNLNLFYLSSFFAGIAVSNKYEFIPYCFIYLILLFYKKISLKNLLLGFVTFLTIPVLCFGFLFYQGLTIRELYNNLKDIYYMTNTVTLKFFYTISGLVFMKPTLGILMRNFLKTVLPLVLLSGGIYYYPKFKFKSIIVIILACVLGLKFVSVETFVFLPFLLFIVFCLFYKKISFDIKIFSFAVLLMSLKVFWSTAINSYGLFFIPVLLIALISYLKKDFYKSVIVYLLVLSAGFLFINYKVRKEKNIKITSERGIVYESFVYEKTAQEFVGYIIKKTKTSDKILILPEGLFFNFLTNRKSDDYYNSYLPLYVETFGEERLINSIRQNKPDYIFIHNFPTSDYYFKSICRDYGFGICEYINEKYFPKDLLLGEFTIFVFKKK